jgi:hypothetical protein
MNVKVLLSILTIIVALFIGGIMPNINDHPIWSYVLWGLAGILLIIVMICHFIQRKKRSTIEEHNPNIRWLE